MCRRESVSRGENRFLQACFLSSVSCAFERIQRLCGGKLSPLEICKAAEVLGRREKVRVYEFLKEPLIRRFGEKWYNDLCEAAEAYLKEYGK